MGESLASQGAATVAVPTIMSTINPVLAKRSRRNLREASTSRVVLGEVISIVNDARVKGPVRNIR
jgi:hypothetical protein